MSTITTEHRDGSTVRTVEVDGAEHEFDVDDSGDYPTHEYRGEGEAPAAAVEALEEWVAEYHDVSLEELRDGADEQPEENTEGSE